MAKYSHTKQDKSPLPTEPIDRIVGPLARFMHVEAAGGVVLLLFTVAALGLANSPWSEAFLAIWKTKVGVTWGEWEFVHSLKHLINDGLMAVFFFVIGLEVKRELVVGELSDLRKAVLPVAAALGGMILPAGIYIAVELGNPGLRGWGIPMATDIAFVVGCMAILGRRVPASLRVMLLSLAIADDIGAILVIAIGYTDDLSLTWLMIGFAGIAGVYGCARLGVRSFAVYTILGAFVWFAFHESGVHATIAGVILGLMTPARSYISQGRFGSLLESAHDVFTGDWEQEEHRPERLRKFQRAARETIPPLEYLENTLHPYVSFAIMPLFALANAGVVFKPTYLASSVAIATMLGLVVGKPLGIALFSWLAVVTRIGKKPQGVSWTQIVAGGCLAGIGFTMAMFIAALAFSTSGANVEGKTQALSGLLGTAEQQKALQKHLVEAAELDALAELLTTDEQHKALEQFLTAKETASSRTKMLDQAKIGVLAGSAISAALGMGLLLFAGGKP